MRAWWDSREPRERVLLAVLAVLTGLLAMVFLLILPALDARTDAERALSRAEADYNIVARAAGSIGGDSGVRAPFDRTALLSAASDQGLQITRIQTDGETGFAVWIDDAQTEALYGMFDMLLSDYAGTMERVMVSTDANGRLSAQFTIR